MSRLCFHVTRKDMAILWKLLQGKDYPISTIANYLGDAGNSNNFNINKHDSWSGSSGYYNYNSGRK